ncbi:hypothetical protein QYZ88_011115 [Lachnospiraceae bacterium C1.1]|nr:hypothetical protein [Lachnospiraceae bacterium C1.1]
MNLDNKTSLINYIKRTFLILASCGIIGSILMILVWCIPDSLIRPNVESAYEIFNTEGTEQHDIKFISYFYGMKLVPDKDVMSTVLANDPDRSPIEKAMDINGYSRYWHGYHVVLRPLLTFFNYGQFRYILFTFFAFLIYGIVRELNKSFEKLHAGICFVITLILNNFFAVPFSYHVSMAFLVAFTAMLVMLKKKGYLQDDLKSWSFYMLVGGITSYVDFLTTPIVTLGLPLLADLLWRIKKSESGLRENVILIFRNSLSWGIGYVLVWAEKWVIGSLILKQNVLADSMAEAAEWQTNAFGQKYTFLSALAKNLACLLPFGGTAKELIPFLFIYLMVGICLIYLIIKNRTVIKGNIYKIIPLLIVAAFPYIWILLMHNHSGVHATFWVYRIQTVAVFGLVTSFNLALIKDNGD